MKIKNIILVEQYKLFRNLNYILFGIYSSYGLMLTVLGYFVFFEKNNMPVNWHHGSALVLYESLTSKAFPFIVIAFSYFFVINISREISQGTIQKNISDGATRNDYIIGKMLMVVILPVVFIIIEYIKLFIVGLCLQVYMVELFSLISIKEVIDLYTVMVCYGFFGILFGLFFRNTILGFIVMYLYKVVEQILEIFHKKFIDTKFIEYLPLKTFDAILEQSFITQFQIVIIILYIGAFIFFSALVIRLKQFKS